MTSAEVAQLNYLGGEIRARLRNKNILYLDVCEVNAALPGRTHAFKLLFNSFIIFSHSTCSHEISSLESRLQQRNFELSCQSKLWNYNAY